MALGKRRTEIRIETHEINIIRYSVRSYSARCRQCLIEVPAYSPEEAAALLGVDVAAINSCVRVNRFHLIGEAKRLPMVCGRSLLGEGTCGT